MYAFLIDKARCVVKDSGVAVGCSLVSIRSYFFAPIIFASVDWCETIKQGTPADHLKARPAEL